MASGVPLVCLNVASRQHQFVVDGSVPDMSSDAVEVTAWSNSVRYPAPFPVAVIPMPPDDRLPGWPPADPEQITPTTTSAACDSTPDGPESGDVDDPDAWFTWSAVADDTPETPLTTTFFPPPVVDQVTVIVSVPAVSAAPVRHVHM